MLQSIYRTSYQYILYLWSADNKCLEVTNNEILQGVSDHDIVFLEFNVLSNKDMTVKRTLWFQLNKPR